MIDEMLPSATPVMDIAVEVAPLDRELDPRRFGNKAARLAHAAVAGLRIPPSEALSCAAVKALINQEPALVSAIVRRARRLGPHVAVRSSAPSEDDVKASHAGLFKTVLQVPATRVSLTRAIRTVADSARSAPMRAYGRTGQRAPAMAVLLQRMVPARSAGVAFTRDPVTGVDEILIESSWGLGDPLVSGRVVPDFFRVGSDGRVLESRLGSKKVGLLAQPSGGVRQVHPRRRGSSLTAGQVNEVAELGRRCEAAFGFPSDLEWAYSAGGVLYLLQCRPITTAVS